jgi:parallel beta-helix repeat protein
MNRKGTAIWLSFVLVFSFIVIIVEIAPVVEAPTIIYVGSGVGNHTASIQDAIDNFAIPGDTVYVYSGVYYENVVVSKTINLTGENRDTTIIDGGGKGDVVSLGGVMVNISGFTIRNSGNKTNLFFDTDAGIDMAGYNCKVFNNNINSYNNIGIVIGGSWHNITNNNISDNAGSGIHMGPIVWISNNNTISNNTFFNNSGGISGEECPKNIVKDNVFLYNGHGGIILPYSKGWIISGNIIINNDTGIGIHLHDADNITISDNTVLHHNTGILLNDASSWNNIEGNNISNCRDGIYLGSSSVRNNITGNNVYLNTWCGISINRYCGWNNVTGNIVSSNNNFSLVLWDQANENKVIGNTISSNNGSGIYVEMSSWNNITSNDIYSNTGYGIFLLFNSDWNNITNNMISNNSYGIYIFDSSNNKIYHNNFINNNNSNSPQVFDDTNNENQWDNSYPSGGNYWSDFDEPGEGAYDDYKGPDQNIPGSDGIVDNGTVAGGGKNPYVIDADSQDNYPFIAPYKNCMILKQGWNLISIPLIQSDESIDKVLSSISGEYYAVQWYDASDGNDPWKHYHTSKPPNLNDLHKINHTMALYIYMTSPGVSTFVYNGTQPTSNQTITLHPGWNMVGYPSLTSYNRTVGLNNLTFDTHVDSIWTYDAATQKWDEIGSSDHFKLRRGYWIHAKTTCEWEIPL